MVSASPEVLESDANSAPIRISSFSVSGGIFGRNQPIVFPEPPKSGTSPLVVILSGPNGSGKTTILRMISGILEMNFDVFRQIPFETARLQLSDGTYLSVQKTCDSDFPLLVEFNNHSVRLFRSRGIETTYTERDKINIDEIKKEAIPIFKRIDFEFLDIHRSLALRTPRGQADRVASILAQLERSSAPVPEVQRATLASRVRNFMREAQVNYRKFFSAEELELLPRIVERFKQPSKVATTEELLGRLRAIQSRFSTMKRFGLQTDDDDLTTLVELLSQHSDEPHALTLLETHIEMQENRNKARELIATRLLEFELIMDNFLSKKSVRIDARVGLQIESEFGTPLDETELSSGEYHFLFMMVAALLCQRSGSIIAIDEPELSLHVTWQRKIVNALAKCAAGASPLFLFATHSAAISAEHSDRVHFLCPLE